MESHPFCAEQNGWLNEIFASADSDYFPGRAHGGFVLYHAY